MGILIDSLHTLHSNLQKIEVNWPNSRTGCVPGVDEKSCEYRSSICLEARKQHWMNVNVVCLGNFHSRRNVVCAEWIPVALVIPGLLI